MQYHTIGIFFIIDSTRKVCFRCGIADTIGIIPITCRQGRRNFLNCPTGAFLNKEYL